MADNPNASEYMPQLNKLQAEDASGMRDNVWPFKNEEQSRQAAEVFCRFHTKSGERIKILAKFKKSKTLAMPGMMVIFNSFIRLDIELRHQIMDIIAGLVQEGVDISSLADPLSANLNDSNYALLEKVCSLIVSMGEGAKGAMERALGCTRNTIREIRMAGIKVLGAIGTPCGVSILRRLESLRKMIPENDKDARRELEKSISAISGNTAADAVDQSAKQDETRCFRSSDRIASLDSGMGGDSRRFMIDVMEKVKNLSQPSLPQVDRQAMLGAIKLSPPALRMAGLVKCLESQDPSLRFTAAKIITAFLSDAGSCVHAIAGAYKREQVQAIKDVLFQILSRLSESLKAVSQTPVNSISPSQAKDLI